MSKWKCKLCGQIFDDDGDCQIHIGFSHQLIEEINDSYITSKQLHKTSAI